MKQRVGEGSGTGIGGLEDFRRAAAELGGEVLRLEAQLPGRHRDGVGDARRARDPGAVEPVAAAVRLVRDRVEVGGDGPSRAGVLAEAVELWMTPITAGLPGEDFLREQPFSPEGDEALPV